LAGATQAITTGVNMIARSLSLLAVTAFVSAAAATQALAGCCGCGYTCAPPAQIQIWGLSPTYVVNQGPVLTGPGFYTSPTYEGEQSTVDYPYVGEYPSYYRPYDGRPYADPFRHRLYHPYWQGVVPARPHHFEIIERRESGVIYRHGFGRRAITMSRDERWESRGHRDIRDPRDR
jgi:hypothetical protein